MGRRKCSHGGFHGHGGTPSDQSSISRWDFPWNKPTILGYPYFRKPHMVCWWNRLMFKEEQKFKIWHLNQAIVVDMTWCDASICSTGLQLPATQGQRMRLQSHRANSPIGDHWLKLLSSFLIFFLYILSYEPSGFRNVLQGELRLGGCCRHSCALWSLGKCQMVERLVVQLANDDWRWLCMVLNQWE